MCSSLTRSSLISNSPLTISPPAPNSGSGLYMTRSFSPHSNSELGPCLMVIDPNPLQPQPHGDWYSCFSGIADARFWTQDFTYGGLIQVSYLGPRRRVWAIAELGLNHCRNIPVSYSSWAFFQSRNTSGIIQGGAGRLYSVLEDPGRGQVRR